MSAWVAGATLVVGAAGAVMSKQASDKAARAEQQGAQGSIDEQRRQYDQTRTDFAPYRKTGYAALDRLNALTLGKNGAPDYSAFYKDPGYNFERTEGMRGIDQSYAGRAGGNALRALGTFTTGLADKSYGNYWNRVKGLADMGEGATGTVANAGARSADSIGNSLIASGDASASAEIGGANALNGGINTALNNYLLYKGGYYGRTSRTPQTYDMEGLPPG